MKINPIQLFKYYTETKPNNFLVELRNYQKDGEILWDIIMDDPMDNVFEMTIYPDTLSIITWLDDGDFTVPNNTSNLNTIKIYTRGLIEECLKSEEE